jgi:hypothetical protein
LIFRYQIESVYLPIIKNIMIMETSTQGKEEMKMEVMIPKEFVDECRACGLTDGETRTLFMKAIELGVASALDDIEALAESCWPE